MHRHHAVLCTERYDAERTNSFIPSWMWSRTVCESRDTQFPCTKAGWSVAVQLPSTHDHSTILVPAKCNQSWDLQEESLCRQSRGKCHVSIGSAARHTIYAGDGAQKGDLVASLVPDGESLRLRETFHVRKRWWSAGHRRPRRGRRRQRRRARGRQAGDGSGHPCHARSPPVGVWVMDDAWSRACH